MQTSNQIVRNSVVKEIKETFHDRTMWEHTGLANLIADYLIEPYLYTLSAYEGNSLYDLDTTTCSKKINAKFLETCYNFFGNELVRTITQCCAAYELLHNCVGEILDDPSLIEQEKIKSNVVALKSETDLFLLLQQQLHQLFDHSDAIFKTKTCIDEDDTVVEMIQTSCITIHIANNIIIIQGKSHCQTQEDFQSNPRAWVSHGTNFTISLTGFYYHYLYRLYDYYFKTFATVLYNDFYAAVDAVDEDEQMQDNENY